MPAPPRRLRLPWRPGDDARGRARGRARARRWTPRRATIRAGPHDQPQSMCPAFGSLRVGLRMRRVATILSGSACCVYGLTFTSRTSTARSARWATCPSTPRRWSPASCSRTSATRCFETAKPEDYDAVVITNLCVPTASGVPLDLLPKEINGVRIIGIDVPGFGVPTHAEAKDVLAGAMLRYARSEAEAGPVARPRNLVEGEPTVALIGELFPADPMGIGALLAPMGSALAPQTPCARVARPVRRARLRRRRRRASLLHGERPRVPRGGPPVVGSGPVGVEGTAAWLDAIGQGGGRAAAMLDARSSACCPRSRRAGRAPIKARITVSGYEGSELLVARLLVEAGAEVPYVGTACPRTEWSDPDREWLEARGTCMCSTARRWSRISPRCGCEARPRARHHAAGAEGEGARHPALYFTNMVSARPLFGPAGAGSLAGSSRRRPAGASASRAWSASSRASARRTGRLRLQGQAAGPAGLPRAAAQAARGEGQGRRSGGDLRDARPRPRSGRRLLGRRLRLLGRRGLRWSSTVRWAARTCRSPRCCTTPTRCRRTSCRSS
jgi:3,8-divinyl chlorophyllide a/chlorophyllide a reductase subunit Y